MVQQEHNKKYSFKRKEEEYRRARGLCARGIEKKMETGVASEVLKTAGKRSEVDVL